MSRSAEKMLELLNLVGEGHRNLHALATASQMPKSTVHRLLRVLVSSGFVRTNANEFQLGYRLLELGELARMDLRLPAQAWEKMKRLSQETNETVHLGELDGSHIIYLEKVDGNRGLQMASRVGLRSPAQCTAMGKALLAYLEEEDAASRLLDIPPRTPHTLTTKAQIMTELASIRENGYAFDREENEIGIRCVAAPIWDHTGRVVAAISLSGATQFVTEQRQAALVPAVVECAAEVSQELGGRRFALLGSKDGTNGTPEGQGVVRRAPDVDQNG